jgi:hypothetical protein
MNEGGQLEKRDFQIFVCRPVTACLWPTDRTYAKVVAHVKRTTDFAEAGE